MPVSYAVVYLRKPDSAWPADLGDDPAFVAAAESAAGVITWGVCRRSLRNLLVTGDVVVFFAADRLPDQRPARYSWIGYATVHCKVSQPEIWENEDLAAFRSYSNLLIRPDADGYVHAEHAPRAHWHEDWI